MRHSPEYLARLRSIDWSKLRADRITEARWHCERCGLLAYDLQLHHLHYATLGEERREDLELLCTVCHRRADAERDRRIEEERWRRRVIGWGTAVFGESLFDSFDFAELEEMFVDWLAIGGEER